MGVSSDGVLYFGFMVGEDESPPDWLEDVEDHDFDTFLYEKAGIDYEESTYEQRKEIKDSCPADLYRYCSYDYPMYILGVRGAEHRAYRGDAVEIGSKELEVPQDKIDAFKAWCLANDIEWQEPKWLLCSMYG